MIKVVLYLFLIVILISVLRSVLGILGKAFSGFVGGDASSRRAASEPRIAGELKRDPVCGTYVSTETSIKRTVAGEVVHFCSESCSARYAKR